MAMSQELIYRRRWAILSVLVLSLLVVVLDTSILNVALKTLAEPKPKGLGASQTQLEWATNAYTLAFAGLLFTWGVLGDRLGRKRILLGGMIAFGVSSALCAYASSPDMLIAFRALMGISGAAVLPATLAIISNVFEPAERPKAIGLWAGAVGLALAIGPVTGGVLLAHFWWGSVFLVNVPICVIAVSLMLRLVPDSHDPNPGKLDPVGVLLSIAGITAIVFGIVRGGDIGWTHGEVVATLLVGVLLLYTFIWWERRYSSPILDVTLFRNPRFSSAVGIIALVFLAYMGLVFILSFYFQAARDYSPLRTGLLFLPLAAGQMLASTRSSGLVQRFGPRTMVSIGLTLITLAFVYYSQAGAHSPVLPLLVVLFIQGIGIGNVMPPATTSIMMSVPRDKAGSGSAVSNTARQVGGCLGIAVLGAIMTSAYRSGVNPHLRALPQLAHHPGTVDSISASITATLTYAAQLGHAGDGLVTPAVTAFIRGMHEAALGSVVVGVIGIVAGLIWLPRTAPGVRGPAPAGAGPAQQAAPSAEPEPVAVAIFD
jgi:MFS transporter, DHA2 family, multidrug resistance protein